MSTGKRISEYDVLTSPDDNDLIIGNDVDGDDQTTGVFTLSSIFEAYNIPAGDAPVSAVSLKPSGNIAYDSSYLYITTSAGANKRVPVNTWPHSKAYIVANSTGTREIDASTCTLDDVIQVLCQLIIDLQSLKYLE